MNQICEVLILADLFEERRGPATVLRRGGAGRGRPEAARRAGLEVVEKLLTRITSGSGLALGQATSRSSWISLGLAADMRDQSLAQLPLGELVVQATDGKPDHIAGRTKAHRQGVPAPQIG